MRLACALTLGLSAAACATAPVATPRDAHGDSRSYANFLIGRLADMSYDYASASERLYGAAQLAPDDPELLESALETALAADDIARARSAAHLAQTRGTPIAYGDVLQGADALSAGHWSDARRHFANVRGSGPEALAAKALSSWASAGAGRAAREVEALASLNAGPPFSAVFAYQQAMMLDVAGDNAAARDSYAQANQDGVWMPPALERQADLLARMNARAEAISMLDPANGAGANPALAAARARAAAGQNVAAAPLTPARGAAITLYGFASIYNRDAQYADGLALLSLALALDPNLDAARIAYAQAQTDLGHPEAGHVALDRVAPDSPYRATANSMQAWLLFDSGQKEEAIALARANAAQGGVLAQRALADLSRANEDYAAAEPLYTAVINAQPAEARDWRLYFSRGAARERLGRIQDSEADMRQALALSPDQSDVLNYLGYMLVDRTEKISEGMALIERAVALRPSSGAIVDSLGWAYFKQGRYQRALQLLERAVELEPSDPTLNDHLGDVYWRVGRRIEARYQWRRALTFNAPTSDRPAIEAKLHRGLRAENTVRDR